MTYKNNLDYYETCSEEELLSYLKDTSIDPSELTYLAEIAGRRTFSKEIIDILCKYMSEHKSPYVREGAMLGLSNHLYDTDVFKLFEYSSISEELLTLRQMCKDILKFGGCF